MSEPREILARAAESWIGSGDVAQRPMAVAQLAALREAGFVVVKADRRDWQRDAEHHRCPVCGVEFDNEWWGLPVQDGSAAE